MNNVIPRGQISTILLSCLLDSDKYGIQLLQDLQEKSSNQISIKQPTLYSTLSRMEKQGYISSYWRDSEIGGKRHYYRLTGLGKKFLQDNENTVLANFVITEENNEKNITKMAIFEDKNDLPPVAMQSVINSNQQKKDVFDKTTQSSFTENLKTSNSELIHPKDDGIFLKPEETLVEQKNIMKYDNLKNQNNQPLDDLSTIRKDDAVFITDSLLPEQIPKVKRIENLNFDITSKNDITRKLNKPMRPKTAMDKIELLYQKTKRVGLRTQDLENLDMQQPQTLESLKNRYEEMNIKFYSFDTNTQEIVNSYGKISNKYLFAKYFTIFMLVLLESLGVWLIYYLTQGGADYSIAYIIIPILFSFPAIFFLFSRKKERRFQKSSASFWLSLLIFVVGIALIYCLNLLLGITFVTILNFETTFVYPSLLLTNVLVAGIFDCVYCKKFC